YGESPALAVASRVSSAAGLSSKRSRDAHPIARSSVAAHSASSVDFPYPAGAVTPTTRDPLERAPSISARRLTPPVRGGLIATFASRRIPLRSRGPPAASRV